MSILVVLAHPNPGSFNHAIAATALDALARTGNSVVMHDLYAEQFDPLLLSQEIPEGGPVPQHIQRHCDDLQSAEGIVIIHPHWWGQPPGILKGWIDRVIRPGFAYRFEDSDGGEGIPLGLLRARAAVVLNTSNTPAEREQSAFGDPLESIWRRCIFGLCGVREFHRRTFGVVVTSSAEQRRQWLGEVRTLLTSVFPERSTRMATGRNE